MKKITLLFTTLLIATFSWQAQAQLVPDNTCTVAFDDISTTGADLSLGDDGEANITIPFAFTLDGVSSTDLRVGNNGGVLFGVTTGNVGSTSTPTAQGFYPFADDIDSDYGAVYWETLGTTPNRRVVILWNDRPHWSNSPSGATFELILHETSNEITFLYQDTIFDTAADDAVSAGILVVGANGIYTYSTNTALAGVTCINWTVPSCPKPTGLSAAVTDVTASLSWTAGGSETTWNVEWGVSGFTQGAGAMITGASNPAPLTGLTPAISYDFYVQADCGGGDLSVWAGPFNFTTTPVNDDCSGATPYTDTFGTIPAAGTCTGTPNSLDLSGATNDIGNDDPSCDTISPNNGVWFTWTATSVGLTFDAGTGFPGLAVYEAGTCGTLTEVACLNNLDGQVSGLTIGNDYIFYIWDDTAGTTVTFCLEEFTPSVNDDCSGAIPYTDVFGTIPAEGACTGTPNSLDLSTATNDIGNDDPSCDTLSPNNGVWFTWTATSVGLTFDAGTGFPGLVVYEAGACGTLTEVACLNNSDGQISGLTMGNDYIFYIWDDTAGTTVTFCLEEFTPPVGAVCTDSIVVGTLPYTTTDDTANYGDNYTGSPGATGCGTTSSYLNGDDVVYSYTATADASINIAMTGIGSTWSGVFVYTDCADIGTACVAGQGNGSSTADYDFDLAVVNGTTYYIVISTFASPQSTAYTLDITENTCANPTATYTVVDDCATSGGFLIDVDITDLGSATSLTVSDGTTTIPVTATGVVQFGSYANATNVTITVTNDQDGTCQISSGVLTQTTCPLPNDDCSGATPYTDTFGVIPVAGTCTGTPNSLDLSGATNDIGNDDPSCDTFSVNNGVWFTWTATSVGLTFDAGTGFPGLAVYEAGTCGTLTEVACLNNLDGQVSGLTIGNDYILYIWDDTAGTTVTFCLEEFTPPPVPPNDACVDATIVNTLPYSDTLDATSATNNAGFIDNVCGTNGMNDGVWYTFTTVDAGTVDIAITGVSGWDPEVALYSGSCGAFACVGRADSGLSGDGESLTGQAVAAGTQYWINVGNWSDSTDNPEGPFTIDITTNDTTTLGLENNNIEGFSMYPNPVNDIVRFNAQDAINTISIYNLLGQEVVRTQPNASNTSINMSNLPTGMYVVKVQVGEQLGTYRVVKK